jgi:hypothetical protein
MSDPEILRPGPPTYAPDPLEVDAIAAELVQRLRPSLGGMPEAEFMDLVRAIARRRHRWNVQARARGV